MSPPLICRVVLWLVAFCAGQACGGERAAASGPTPREWIEAFLAGEAEAAERWSEGGVEAVGAIEGHLLRHEAGVDGEVVERLVGELSSVDYAEREGATRALKRLMPAARDLIARHRVEAEDAEARLRLRHVLESDWDRREPELRALVGRLYQRHADALFESRAKRLLGDPDDRAARQFMRLVDWRRIADRVESMPKERRLKLMLHRRLLGGAISGGGESEAETLGDFSPDAVIEQLKRMGYDAVLEPPQRDGAYLWTTRAKQVEGETAVDVVRMSIRAANAEAIDRGRILHFKTWRRWTYVFRFDRSYHSTDGVAVLERHERPDEPFGEQADGQAALRCDTVRGIPDSAEVPTVTIHPEEPLEWAVGKVYEWARPLFPTELRKRLNFRPNEHPPPTRIERPAASGP